MKFETPAAVVFTLAFLVPGFVWSAVLAMLIPRRPRQAEIHFIEFFTLSCINNAAWLWLFVYFFITNYVSREPLKFSLWILVALFVSPAVLALVSGALAQRDWPGRFLRSLGFRTVHHLRSAWDWHFSRQQRLWVVVTLRDNSVIYGYFGYKSFAGDEPKDLYLEGVYEQTQSGLVEVENTYGAFITENQISAVEFYKVEGEEYG